jgi:hypothetical protein
MAPAMPAILLGIVRFERIVQLIEEDRQVAVTLAQRGLNTVSAVRLASSRGIAPMRTHVIERGLYCFLELGALHILRRSGIVHRSPMLLDDRR